MVGPAASGRQFGIEHGAFRAVVAEIGASLRSFTCDGDDVVVPAPPDAIAADGRGQVLAPWPNRLDAGRYRFAGREGVAPLNEPDRRMAIHGLVRWTAFVAEHHEPAAVRLAANLLAQPAYPFAVRLACTYSLDDAGLKVAFEVENLAGGEAPFGIGFHPYLECGPGGVDAARLSVPAAERLVLSARGLPVGTAPLTGEYGRLTDASATLSGLVLDDCFGGFSPGGAEAMLRRGDGRAVRVWAEAAFGYLMCFSGDSLGAPMARRALALEPMTCPPNALSTGTGLLRVQPGAPLGAVWGIEPLS